MMLLSPSWKEGLWSALGGALEHLQRGKAQVETTECFCSEGQDGRSSPANWHPLSKQFDACEVK